MILNPYPFTLNFILKKSVIKTVCLIESAIIFSFCIVVGSIVKPITNYIFQTFDWVTLSNASFKT